jgi:cell division septum initiation protein DivIVA
MREKDRLEEAREEAESALLEALNRLQRIRRQEKHLREKAAEMVRRGCEDLEELEAAEEKERLEQSRNEALSEVQLLEDHGVIDWSSLAESSSSVPDFGVVFSSVGGKT